MTKHELSVIVPLFNCERYIESCLTSIVKELAEGDELIVIDDGSTDRSAAHAQSAINGRENAIFVSKENGGVSSARNVGIDRSGAEYIMFVDADDLLIPGWRSKVDCALEQSDEADLVFIGNYGVGRNNCSIDGVIDAIIGLNADLILQAGSSAWSKLFKLAAVNGPRARFNENIIHGEDALFNIEVLLNASRCSIQDASIYRYRMRETSATHTFSERFLASNLAYLDALRTLLSASPLFDERHIRACVDYSFVSSVFIYAKQLASLHDTRRIFEGTRLLYQNTEYAQLLSSIKVSGQSNLKERVSYFMTKRRLLALLACAYRLPLRYKSTEERWIEI
ncbi:glycosyltransferase family A protein [Candidatus Collinsella stercoripullorum]|uniref:glycosyltransferase family A protein n=1 Tax=Candidatus Collinsella stercoripullorum TaxID=2838522 RepID=UPI0022E48DC4|nr:glycosyltransferase family A protein [Candidatus Collinsella stercoripullorum]